MENFDIPPIYDPITDKGDGMSDTFQLWLGNFVQNLIGYLTQFGIFVPRIDTTTRDRIRTAENGMIIYNTTLNKMQIFEAGLWKTFTTF